MDHTERQASPASERSDAPPQTAPKRYKLRSIGDIIKLYARLPEDRAQLMLREVFEAIPKAAAANNLMKALGMTAKTLPAVWIDDDKGKTDLNYRMPDGSPRVTLRYQKTVAQVTTPPTQGEADHTGTANREVRDEPKPLRAKEKDRG